MVDQHIESIVWGLALLFGIGVFEYVRHKLLKTNPGRPSDDEELPE
jgi:hypothetical protein